MPGSPSAAEPRPILEVLSAQPTLEGAGVHLKRAFGQAEVPRLDPFLLLDDFRSDNPADYVAGFPWHPHRGMETVTYVMDGRVEHMDSMGNRGVTGPGDVQWMTAGSGILHQEMPKPLNKTTMAGFQLWVNLPRAQKMRDPRYQEVANQTIPLADLGKGVKVKVVAGEVGGVRGPVRDITVQPEFLDVMLEPHSEFRHYIPRDHTAFAYVTEGRGRFEPSGEAIDDHTLVHWAEGDMVEIRTDAKPARFFLVSGKPTNEPVAWWGPMVMNTQQELRVAIEEFQNGTFIKKRGAPGALSQSGAAPKVRNSGG